MKSDDNKVGIVKLVGMLQKRFISLSADSGPYTAWDVTTAIA